MRWRRFLAIFMAVSMIAGVTTGCGKDEEKKQQADTEVETNNQESEQEETIVSVAGKDEEVKADINWYMMAPTEDEWTLTTANEFLGFINLIANGGSSMTFEGKTIKLGADLIFNEGDASTWNMQTEGLINISDYQVAKPTWDSAFAGTFDGQGHTISGLFITDDTPVTSEDIRGAGLFLWVRHDATLKNVTIKNSYVESIRHAGGLFAEIGGKVTVENVHIQATVKASAGEAGGLVGKMAHDATIKDCSFDCNVTSGVEKDHKDGAGGVIGAIIYQTSNVQKTLSMENVLVTGKINGDRAGGLVGNWRYQVSSLGFVLKNVAVGAEINGASYAGNLVGGGVQEGDYSSCSMVDAYSDTYTLDNGLKDVADTDKLISSTNSSTSKKTLADMQKLFEGAF